jgi:hypothetical protein
MHPKHTDHSDGLSGYPSARLLVHQFDVSGPQQQPQLMKCNCDSSGHCKLGTATLSQIGAQGPQSSYAPSTSAQLATYIPAVAQPPNYYGGYAATTIAMTSAAGYGYQQPASSYGYPHPTTQASSSSMPAYSPNQYGLPVNISQGAIAVEHRGIHIGGINKKCNEDDVRKLLQRKVGEAVTLKLINGSSGKFKGSAVAEFSTAEEATRAIQVLDGYSYKGRPLIVRLSREAQPATNTPTVPVVVNGSTYGY